MMTKMLKINYCVYMFSYKHLPFQPSKLSWMQNSSYLIPVAETKDTPKSVVILHGSDLRD